MDRDLNEIGNRIRLIVMSSAKKVHMNDIPKLYWTSYDKQLDYRTYNCRSLDHLIRSLSNFVHVSRGPNPEIVPIVDQKFAELESLNCAKNRNVQRYNQRSHAIIVPNSDTLGPMGPTKPLNTNNLDLSGLEQVKNEILRNNTMPMSANNENNHVAAPPINRNATVPPKQQSRGSAKPKQPLITSTSTNHQKTRPPLPAFKRLPSLVSDTFDYTDTSSTVTTNEIRNHFQSKGLVSKNFPKPHDSLPPVTTYTKPSITESVTIRQIEKASGSLASKYLRTKIDQARDSVAPAINGDGAGHATFISDKFARQLRDLLTRNRAGIRVDELFAVYERTFGQSLQRSIGSSSAIQFVREHRHIFDLRKSPTNEWLVFLPKATDECDDAVHAVQQQLIKANVSQLTINAAGHLDDSFIDNLVVPQDLYSPPFVTYNQDIARQWITPDMIDSAFDVQILEVFDLHKFWVSIVPKETFNKFNSEFQEFYVLHHECYELKAEHLKPNFYCVVSVTKKFKEKTKLLYRRAKIICVKKDRGTVEVFLIDYGSLCEIQLSNLFYLDVRYVREAQQAVRAGLFNVKPINEVEWPLEVIEYFVGLTKSSRLIASIKDVDNVEKILKLDLVAKNDSGADVNISKKLVENLVANYCDPSMIIELITFEDIELGRFPNRKFMRSTKYKRYLRHFYVPFYYHKRTLDLAERELQKGTCNEKLTPEVYAQLTKRLDYFVEKMKRGEPDSANETTNEQPVEVARTSNLTNENLRKFDQEQNSYEKERHRLWLEQQQQQHQSIQMPDYDNIPFCCRSVTSSPSDASISDMSTTTFLELCIHNSVN